MPKISLKYRRKIGSVFLAAYLAFILVGTIHYHCYDLNPRDSINREANDGGMTDLNIDFFSVCSLHQFSQTIDNKSYTSADIIQTLSCIQTKESRTSLRLTAPELYSKTSPRAPPNIIS